MSSFRQNNLPRKSLNSPLTFRHAHGADLSQYGEVSRVCLIPYQDDRVLLERHNDGIYHAWFIKENHHYPKSLPLLDKINLALRAILREKFQPHIFQRNKAEIYLIRGIYAIFYNTDLLRLIPKNENGYVLTGGDVFEKRVSKFIHRLRVDDIIRDYWYQYDWIQTKYAKGIRKIPYRDLNNVPNVERVSIIPFAIINNGDKWNVGGSEHEVRLILGHKHHDLTAITDFGGSRKTYETNRACLEREFAEEVGIPVIKLFPNLDTSQVVLISDEKSTYAVIFIEMSEYHSIVTHFQPRREIKSLAVYPLKTIFNLMERGRIVDGTLHYVLRELERFGELKGLLYTEVESESSDESDFENSSYLGSSPDFNTAELESNLDPNG